MSWMDSASGSSSFHGGGGMAGNNGPSGAGTGGRGGDSGNSYSRTGGLGGGLSTGNTWHGNTAFGPAGGMVQGFVSMRDGGINFGLGPSMKTFTNFKNPNGTDMFTDKRVQGKEIKAKNANQAAGIAKDLADAYAKDASQKNNGKTKGNGTPSDPSTPTVTPTDGPPPQQPPQKTPGLIHAILGGGGALGFGLNPALGGSWTDAARAYYGGYPRTPYNGSVINGDAYNPNINGPNNSWHGKTTNGMPRPTGEESITPR